MYKLCMLAGIVSCVVSIATGGVAMEMSSIDWESAAVSEPAVVRLLQDIERIRLTRDIADCGALQPIPLYAGAPSLQDWTAFCLAKVRGDAAACDLLPAMLVPDVRSLCHDA